MTIMIGQFRQIAQKVAVNLAELLSTQIIVIDEHKRIIASNKANLVDLSLNLANVAKPDQVIKVSTCFNGESAEVIISLPDSNETISPRVAQAMVELLINQTVVVSGLSDQHQLKNKFISDLLHNPITNEADILREGQILGMDFTRPRAVILVDASEYILAPTATVWYEASESQIRRRAQMVISSIVSFFQLPDDTICAYIGNGEIVILKASTTQDLVAWTDKQNASEEANPSWADLTALKRAGSALLARIRHDTGVAISIGLGRYHPGISGLPRSYQDARAALSLGRRFHGHNRVHCLDSLGIAAFVGVSDERTKIDLARHLLSPLDQEPELLETLDVFFFENCCPSQAAHRLSIHRNTLSYRLDKINSLTGLDPRCFDAAVQIRLALMLRSLKASLPSCANDTYFAA